MSVRSAAITTLGCKTNQFESAAMEEKLRQAGWQIVPFDAGADLVIVNTCTVTAATDSQSRNLIRRAQRLNPDCRVVVTGCYAQVDPQTLAAIPGVALVLGNEEKRDLLQLLAAEDGTVQVGDIRQRHEAEVATLASFAERSRAFVQIQNGCDAFCSYCIIPYARGRSRSVPPAQVLAQVQDLVRVGYTEIVLTGIHIGGYGADLKPSLSLTDLLRQLLAKTGLSRLRLGSLEPTEIPDELLDLIAESEEICPHLHIPLQAGDDTVLTAMRRTYDTAFFRALLQRIRQRLPEAAIGLDVIVGFPGEDDDSFARTKQLLEELPWSHLHVFPYSRRPGTPAASMSDQVPATVSKERAALLRHLASEKLEVFARPFIGKNLSVVVEGGEGELRRGLCRNYLPVRFVGDKSLIGSEVLVKIETFVDGELQGSLM
ncbi:MAG: tRNA (N(6)-L-threonylcarbamoyladenosine(37)-C(2))-methylthiotransferase MtaB [Desulfuromonas sp.]|nr:MAG: tRNA (N(6)-L-threonylcarbamoyladenosine(37)-C(2))-methylthiotransferase MtaB [Desulfuromonas sp.]